MLRLGLPVLAAGSLQLRPQRNTVFFKYLTNSRVQSMCSPFSARLSAFDLDDAYPVTAAIRHMREMRGEMPVGRKIGFTNRMAWPEYEAMWGYVYNRTVHNLAEIGDTFSLVGLAEPRIEPEIVFKLALAPAPGMDETALPSFNRSARRGLERDAFDLRNRSEARRHGGCPGPSYVQQLIEPD